MTGDISKPRKFLSWTQLLCIAAVYCLVTLSFRPTSLLGVVSSGDDTSYISHAFTIALDFDLNYRNEPLFRPGEGLLTPSGEAPAHPVGPGLLASPFVAFFSIFDRIAGNPIISDHKNYADSWGLFGFFVAAACWFLFGAWLYMDALEAIGTRMSRWVILLFASGISLSYYVLIRPTMGHAFEFATVAMVFWGCIRVLVPGKSGRIIPEIAMVMGMLLTLLVRMADLNIILLPALVWGLLLLNRRCSWPKLTLRVDGLVVATAAIFSFFVITSFNMALYGVAFAGIGNTYGYHHAFFSIPEGGPLAIAAEALRSLPLLWPLLITSEFGLLYSAPVLPAGALAFSWILAKNLKQNKWLTAITLLACIIYAAVPLSTVLILKTTGESFGYRYLYDLLPLCLLSTALFLDAASRRAAIFVRSAVVILSLWAVVAVAFTDTNPELRTRNTLNAFGRTVPFSFVGYETALMKTIVTPRGWFEMAGRRLPGFVAIRFGKAPENMAHLTTSADAPKAQNAIDRIVKLRSSYFYAIILSWLIFPLCLVFLCDGAFRTRVIGLFYKSPQVTRRDSLA